MAVISSVGDGCLASTPLILFEAEYESWLVVAHPEKTQEPITTRKHINNARRFFMVSGL
jgi:hypothetical protein